MSFRTRLVLALVGLLLCLLSAAAVVYVAWPLEARRERFLPAPTLFAPPQSVARQAGEL